MFKPRNVIIILILVLVIITMSAVVTEWMLISQSASTASTYVRIAAEAALRSATMSDEFFTSGVTSNANYATGLKRISGSDAWTFARSWDANNTDMARVRDGLLVSDRSGGTDVFKANLSTNVYRRTYLTNPDATGKYREDTLKIFERMYTSDSFKQWSNNILSFYKLDNTSDANGTIGCRKVYWNDSSMMGNFTSGYSFIPRLLTMGTDLFHEPSDATNFYSKLYSKMASLSKNLDDTTSAKFYGINADSMARLVDVESGTIRTNPYDSNELAINLLRGLDYVDHRRISTVSEEDMIANGINKQASSDISVGELEADFYYTPTSMGLTYIDANILGNLFRANMDLLMRAHYINSDGTLSGYSEKPYFSYFDVENDKYVAYTGAQERHGYPANWANCVVNNGRFFYMRGDFVKATDAKAGHYVDLYGRDLITPKIEYVYIPITDENVDALDGDASMRSLLARAVDPVITFRGLLDKSTEAEVNYNGDRLYELVIAKVTFYADFLYPYKTEALRGMAMHFNAIDQDATMRLIRGTGVSAGAERAAIDSLTANAAEADALFDEQTLTSFVPDSENADTGYFQYQYTRYFAVTN